MSIYKANRLTACGAFSMIALLAGISLAQPPEGAPRGEGGRTPEGGRPDGGRPDGGPGGREGMRGDPKMIAEMMLTRFDKDGDKKLSAEELVVALTEMRQQMGLGGPGAGPGGPGGNPAGPGGFAGAGRMFEQNDKDGDGKLTGDEIPERMRQNVARIDTNGDGSIDRAEIEKMMSNFGGGNRPPRDGEQGDRPQRPAAE